MKLKNSVILALVALSAQVFGQDNADFQRLPNGVQYKIFTTSTSPKIKLNDVVSINMIQKTDKDSVLFSSFKDGHPAKLQVQAPKDPVDLMGFLPLLAVKDSALFKIPTDSIFKGAPDSERPAFFPKGSFLSLTVKVEKVQSMEEAMAEYQTEVTRMKGEENSALAKYIAANNLKPNTTASGLRYLITKSSVKPKPVNGDTVYVNYIGSTLEGKVFDSSIEAEASKAGLQQAGRKYEPIKLVLGQGQVIKGWEEGLLLLNEGSKATFLIPSDLGYGPQGAGQDIKPFSSLRFDLELVKVKKPKAAAKPAVKKPAPAKKKTGTPAKKPVAPAKKPTTTTAKPKTSK